MHATRQLGLIALLVMEGLLASDRLAFAQPADAEKPVVGEPAKENEKTVERLIYMPFKNLKAVFETPDASVFLPYGDYLKLIESTMASGLRKAVQPPVSGVITSATYTAKVEKDVAQVSVALVVQALDKGWAEVPVKFGEAAIGKLASDSGKVLLRGTGNGTYSLLLPTAGEHKIQIELTARVRTAPEGKSLEMDIPTVGITSFELIIPEADQTVELKPKLVTEPVVAGAKETRIKASLGSTEKISARWHPRVGTKPDMELLASVSNQTLVTVEDGLVHTDAWLTYEVLRGQLEKVQIAVPKGQRILDITSNAKVKEWKAVEEENRQVVNVELLSRADGKVTLEVHIERAAPTETFDVAGMEGTTVNGIHALNVIRESGTVAVKQGSDLTLTVEEQSGLLRIDDSEVDANLKRPGALYFKYYSPAFKLKLLAKPVEPRLIVDHASQLVFRDDQLRLRSVTSYTIDRAGVFEIKFALPADVTVENVLCDRMKQFDISPDKTTLSVSLREKTMGNLVITVFAIRTLDPTAEKTDQLLPLLEPLGIEVENGKVQVYAPEAIDVITEAQKLVSVQPDPAPQAEGVPNARLVSSWLYNRQGRRAVEIPVRTVRKPTRLTASIGTRVDVKQGQVQVITNLNYIVEYAGLDTFRFAVPEALSSKIQITSTAGGSAPPIKQKVPGQAVDGWVTWTVIMQREVLGAQPFQITYDFSPTVDADGKSEKSAIEAIRTVDPYDKDDGPQGKREITVSRTIGEMTVVKDRALSVTAGASGGDAEPIDVRELQHLAQDGFVAFRYFKQPVKLDLTANKYDIQGVVETVVSKALIEIVIDKASTATYRARYVMKSSERQRLRVDLPTNVEPLGVLVDRKPVALEKADLNARDNFSSYFINVARTKSSDEAFSLIILFRSPLKPEAFQSAGGKLILRLPMIGGKETQGVAVQQLRVALWAPNEFAIIGTPRNFSVETQTVLCDLLFKHQQGPQGTQDLDAWIGADSGGIFEFPIEGRRYQYSNLGGHDTSSKDRVMPPLATLEGLGWWHIPFYTWIVSSAIVVIAIVLRRTSWENKLTLLIVAAFTACAYALVDADLVIHALAISAYGLVVLVALWLIHALLSWRPAPSLVSISPSPATAVTPATSETPVNPGLETMPLEIPSTDPGTQPSETSPEPDSKNPGNE